MNHITHLILQSVTGTARHCRQPYRNGPVKKHDSVSHDAPAKGVTMTLQERLDAMREASKGRIPEATRAVMTRSIDELRASGIMERVARVGQKAPDFTLPNASGQPVRLADLIARGPVVLSFYRGRW
jgi:hypothetical protein